MMTPLSPKYPPPRIGQRQIRLLARLCNACAVSGDEGEVRAIVLEHIRPLADKVWVDAIGNVLAIREGKGENRLRVMLAAHMDEVGFMLIAEEDKGFYRFDVVGGVDSSQLGGKAVSIGREHIPGVIGTKPVHLQKDEEAWQRLSLEHLRIDVGSAQEKKVQVGDRATFATSFAQLGACLRAKALDDRLGVAALIELFRHAPPNIDLLAAFTVQEEVGLRGAKVAAYALQPQLAFVIDSTPANDLPSWDAGRAFSPSEASDNARYNTRLGAGPAIYIADHATLSDPRLVRLLIETAEKYHLPYQIRQPGGGGTDAGAIHKQREGIPSVSISTPTRYLHTAASLARLEDWKNLIALVHAALCELTPHILSAER